MAESSQEKTEDATPKRLREARKKGDVSKSKDLSTVVVMIAVFVAIALSVGFISNEIKELMRFAFEMIGKGQTDPTYFVELGKRSVVVFFKVLIPVFISAMVSGLVIGFLQVGALFTTEPLMPKFEKLNPLEGLKNMFKLQTFVELLKNVIKLLLVFYLAYTTLLKYIESVLLSPRIHLIQTMILASDIVYSFFLKVAILFLFISVLDMGFQRWNYMKKMRMSKDEVKREYKQDEGDPQIKGERRRLHRDMVFGDARKNTKNADGVVSNPSHVAVAIKYLRDEMGAPEVVAKGQNEQAELILQVAREEGIPVVRNIPLAWSLLKVDIGSAVPEELYEPVAEVLSFIYQLKEEKNGKASATQNKSEPSEPETKVKPLNLS